MSARRPPQRAHIICSCVSRDVFGADRMRIVAADTFVGAKPDDVFAIDEGGEDMIRPQRAAGFLKTKSFPQFPVDDVESAATVGRHPNVIARAACDESYWTSNSITLRWLWQISLVEKRAFFGPPFRADPQPPARICFERIDKVTARLALNLFHLAVVDGDESATLRAGVKSIVKKSQTGDLQKTGMVFV